MTPGTVRIVAVAVLTLMTAPRSGVADSVSTSQRATFPVRIRVVDIIPASMSTETNQDSEPNITVDPRNPSRMAASAFTPDPQLSGNSPIFTSLDGGRTWRLNVVVPGASESMGTTADITLRFGPRSGRLYAAVLDGRTLHLNILRAKSLNAPGLMNSLLDRSQDDQPWLEVFSAPKNSGGPLTDHVFVASNNFLSAPKTASIDLSDDAADRGAPAGFVGPGISVEPRDNGGQDAPSVRAVPHHDGTVYAAYIRWTGTTPDGTLTHGDVIVARDDHFGRSAKPFHSLVDRADHLPGIVVRRNTVFPTLLDPSAYLGNQRIGSTLAIAVDPKHSDVVYLAWADGPAKDYTIHVRRSTNRGAAWSDDLLKIGRATNPALAVNDDGAVALLYQSFDAQSSVWSTHVALSRDRLATVARTLMLAKGPEILPLQFDPLLGDYDHILAVGKAFYGVFSSSNTPVAENFPYGNPFQRHADLRQHKLFADDRRITTVKPSIDPFFFEIVPE